MAGKAGQRNPVTDNSVDAEEASSWRLASCEGLYKVHAPITYTVVTSCCLVSHVSQRIDRQMALVFLLFNVATATIFTIG